MTQQPAPVGIDQGLVTAWVRDHVEVYGEVIFERIAGGRSNLTFRVVDERGPQAVLRRPPLGHHPKGAHDVMREARTLRALRGHLAVPSVLATAEPGEYGDSALLLMEFLDGAIVRYPSDLSERFPDETSRARIGPAMAETLASLHSVDPAVLGHESGLSREDHVVRQLRTWHRTWTATQVRESDAIDEGHAWLAAHAPHQRSTAIVHGDFRVDNCLLDRGGEVLGVLDWELSTVGDPMTDVGQMLAYWAQKDDETTILNDPPTVAPGFSSRSQLLDAYVSASGKDADYIRSVLPYYVAFNVWKTACILENVYSRMFRHEMGETDRDPASFGAQAHSVAAYALDLMRVDE